jgi:hypothetical protein
MIDAVLTLAKTGARKSVSLLSYLDAADEEKAQEEAIAWIKGLRHADVGGVPMRGRFTYRGDSLWWFTEVYLHKQQVVRSLFRTIRAFENLIAREEPRHIELHRADRIARVVASRLAGEHIGVSNAGFQPLYWQTRLASMEARAQWLHGAALASRLRARPRLHKREQPIVAAFVHRAFWRTDVGDGSAEAYIGPVLQALESRISSAQLAYVSVGPAENFSARRWWHPLRNDDRSGPATPIEVYASLNRPREARTVWKQRHHNRRALWRSEHLRSLSTIREIDCWPIVREELAGAALLQWPWSARAMDEAGAAVDMLQPRVALTYAEAGGWGRALMLECRRRGIPGVGLQHGFIYRHWLNYLHEDDEMNGDPGSEADFGFPRPDATLLFDDYAGQHLQSRGHFPAETLIVTGSPRLDALVRAARSVDDEALQRVKAEVGAACGPLVLVVTKYREARQVLPALVDAFTELPEVRMVVKTHPAETPDVYGAITLGRSNVVVLPASAPLAPLLLASRAVVTVNSTVALDAAVLGVPALVIGLPNNLSPFVEAGAMAGASAEEMPAALRRILYDEKFRQQLERARGLFLARFRILSDGGAAERSADAVLKLVDRNR